MSAWAHGTAPTVLAAAVCLALLVDLCLGEPPVKCHPVVWMGRYLACTSPWVAPAHGAPGSDSKLGPWVRGAAVWCFGAGLAGSLALGVQALVHGLSWPWQALWLGGLLKPMLAWRMLRDEVVAVEEALAQSLDQGRQRLSWLCSRDVSRLSDAQVRETAIETLAENLNDSVVAPLFWFAVAGLPGAVVYRFANTADAMWGYRGERQGREWTWAGKWAARADDLLSWAPARVTGALLMLGQARSHWSAWGTQARSTPSPNGGWPMAAMALGLGVRLGKPGVYTLNPSHAAPQGRHVKLAVRLATRVVAWTVALAALVLCMGQLSFWKGSA